MLFGLTFYIVTTFILKVDLHFVHIWGIEFLINITVMLAVSHYIPVKSTFNITDVQVVDMHSWKYAKPVALVLFILTIFIYTALGIH